MFRREQMTDAIVAQTVTPLKQLFTGFINVWVDKSDSTVRLSELNSTPIHSFLTDMHSLICNNYVIQRTHI
jgi:hypothetical protein